MAAAGAKDIGKCFFMLVCMSNPSRLNRAKADMGRLIDTNENIVSLHPVESIDLVAKGAKLCAGPICFESRDGTCGNLL